MASFKAKIRGRKPNGLHPVYILCTHGRTTSYMRTDLVVSDKGLNKSDQITDKHVLLRASAMIAGFYDKLQGLRMDTITAKEIVAVLRGEDERISFTDFSSGYIKRLSASGVKRTDGYKQALNSYLRYLGVDSLFFDEITAKNLGGWVESLRATKRAKELYPALLKKIFTAGLAEYNDYDRNVMRITNRPFEFLKAVKSDTPEKRSVSVDVLRAFFGFKPTTAFGQYAQDVCRLSFCLAGMNVADLYELKSGDYRDGKICYERQKTRGKRSDKAYVEVTLPPEATDAFTRLSEGARDGYLLGLSARYRSRDKAAICTNNGAEQITERLGLPRLTTYSFRHSWATIARNEVGASEEDVAFALNHTSAHKVTDRYIRKDFSRIDRLNAEVLRLVFGDE